MKSEVLFGEGDDGKSYLVIKTTPLILGSGLEGIPSYRLETGERLVPWSRPNFFRAMLIKSKSSEGRRRALSVK
jgi:hypothetical protein